MPNSIKPQQAVTGMILSLLFASLFLAGCSSVRSGEPEVQELYREAAKRETRNPVVVIHGILGSRLVERATSKVVWGAFTNEAIDVETPQGARALALDMGAGSDAFSYDPKTADVYPTGPVGAIDVSLLFGVISVDVYAKILRSLGVGGYVDRVSVGPEYAEDHFTCHTFFYDWRRDNVQNAIALGQYLKKTRVRIDRSARLKVEALKSEGSQRSLREAKELEEWLEEGYRFDIVAHSMGGLIARYFLRYGAQDLPIDGSAHEVTWAGAEEVDRLVMVGTPNLGAMDAFNQLLNGFDLAFFLPTYHQAILGTMPAIYQLLPRNDNQLLRDEGGVVADIDLFDPDVWDREGWGLMDQDSEEGLKWLLPDVDTATKRRRRAKAHLAWCLKRAQRFNNSLDKDPETPCPAEIRLFAADTVPTLARGVVSRGEGGRAKIRFAGEETSELGDGTVPRFSATADRRFGKNQSATWLDSSVPWSSITFLPDDHLGLTANPLFTNNLLFFLLEQPPKRSPAGRAKR